MGGHQEQHLRISPDQANMMMKVLLAAFLVAAISAGPLMRGPEADCGVATALKCGKSVVPCISTCKQGVKACAECLGPDLETCCPCLEKLPVLKRLPPSLCGNGSLPVMQFDSSMLTNTSNWAVKGPMDTCTGPHESCCPAPGGDVNNCPASARTSDCDKKKSCCCG